MPRSFSLSSILGIRFTSVSSIITDTSTSDVLIASPLTSEPAIT